MRSLRGLSLSLAWFPALFLLAACGPDGLPVAEEATTDEILGETEDGLASALAFTELKDPLGIGTRGETEMRRVLTSAAQYRNWTGHDAPSTVDFGSGDVVIVYSGGRQSTGGHDANLRGVKLSATGRTLYVTTELVSPGSTCTVTQTSTKPYILAKARAPNLEFRQYTLTHTSRACPAAYRYSEGGVYRGSTAIRSIALVFTGGYYSEGAKTILDALAAKGVKGSFFLTGNYLQQFSTTVARMVQEGHYVGPHSDAHLLYASWDDRSDTLVTRAQFMTDLETNLNRIRSFGRSRKSMPLFIPPYEWYNTHISTWARETGMLVANYTPGSGSELDWWPESDSHFVASQTLYNRILSYEQTQPNGLNGFLLIMHLGTGPERTDKFHKLFPQLLNELIARGYAIQPVDQVLAGTLKP
jgi:peptidoglycan/xylan/chitin deacetylase (PgdA/CDA1 family)